MVPCKAKNGPSPALADSHALHSRAEQSTEYAPLRPPFGFLLAIVSAQRSFDPSRREQAVLDHLFLDGSHQGKAPTGVDPRALGAKLRFAKPGILELPVTTIQAQRARLGHLSDLDNSDERRQ